MFLIADGSPITSSAIIAAIVSAIVTAAVNSFMNRGHNERMVYGQVQKMIEFAISYPYLEDDAFCSNWPAIPLDGDPDKEKEKVQRYENYCCHVFNTLSAVYSLCMKHHLKMTDYLYPKEVVDRHKKWWNTDELNRKGYPPEFRRFVTDILTEGDQK